jgi:hypothetical protein
MMISRFSLLTMTLLTFALACSKQGEGDRCSRLNGSNDCDNGLTCVGPTSGSGSDACQDPLKDTTNCQPYLCCPSQRSAVELCNQYLYGVAQNTGGTGNTGGSSSTGGDEATGGSTADAGNSSTSTDDAGP